VANNRESAVDVLLSAALVVIHSLGASEGNSSGFGCGNERIIVRHFLEPCSDWFWRETVALLNRSINQYSGNEKSCQAFWQ
jgi:hypothetical protein